MSEYLAMTLISLFRSLATVAAIVGAVYLAYHEKQGWGWLIFIAFAIGTFSVKFDN